MAKNEIKKMLTSKLYFAGSPEAVALRMRAKKMTHRFNQMIDLDANQKNDLLKELLGRIGTNSYIEPPFRIDYGRYTTIGNHFYANYDCIFIDVAPITIGNDVFLGPKVSLYTAGHPIDAAIRNEELEYGKPITIGNSVWIGGNTVINPGVTIGNNVVIGSGSVVTKNVPDNVVAVGNPCHVLREITPEDHAYWQQQKDIYLHDND
ncbi:MAG: sugar O-acetyltransferase [Oenococcus sp.]|uniref:sugar O-acetyltransferase n=1 Tax=Oenococcus sp. TaxID=1979414 RepID=UPI0039ECE45E